MKRFSALTVLMMTFNAWGANAAPSGNGTFDFFISGSKFHAMNELEQLAYVEGFTDMWNYSLSFQAPTDFRRNLETCTAKWNAGQTLAIATKYVNAHPEFWDRPVTTMLTTSVIEACEARGVKLRP